MPKRRRPRKLDAELLQDVERYVAAPLTCNEGEEEKAEALFAAVAASLEELRQRLKKGRRGPPQRFLDDDPDSILFPEIERLMKENGISAYAAVVSLAYDEKIPGDAKLESRITRVYKKFLQFTKG